MSTWDDLRRAANVIQLMGAGGHVVQTILPARTAVEVISKVMDASPNISWHNAPDLTEDPTMFAHRRMLAVKCHIRDYQHELGYLLLQAPTQIARTHGYRYVAVWPGMEMTLLVRAILDEARAQRRRDLHQELAHEIATIELMLDSMDPAERTRWKSSLDHRRYLQSVNLQD